MYLNMVFLYQLFHYLLLPYKYKCSFVYVSRTFLVTFATGLPKLVSTKKL